MEESAYVLLGLEQGPASTEAEIKKAYRREALVKHPDKNPNNPRAADEFQALQRAYDLLCDKEARAALDALLKAKAVRAERVAGHDEKRRKMMADLEQREKGWQAARTQEETARAKLQAEMERLRRTAAERAAKRAAEQRSAQAAAAAAVQQQQQQQQQTAAPAAARAGGGLAAAGVPGEVDAEMRERLPRTLKVSWSRKDGEYGAAQLRQIFAAHGPVEDVVLREGKKRKGSALVVMRDVAGAAAAASSANGAMSNPLLVVPFAKAAGAGGMAGDEDSSDVPLQAPGTGAGGTAAGGAAAAAARPAPAFAAGAAMAGGGGLGPRPAAPLFAAGLRPGGGGSAPGLFPAASGSAAPGKPLFAAAAGGGSGGGQQAAGSGAASSFPSGVAAFGSFSSFQGGGLAGSAKAGVHALNGGLEGATMERMRQVAERRRLVEEMERAESGAS